MNVWMPRTAERLFREEEARSGGARRKTGGGSTYATEKRQPMKTAPSVGRTSMMAGIESARRRGVEGGKRDAILRRGRGREVRM